MHQHGGILPGLFQVHDRRQRFEIDDDIVAGIFGDVAVSAMTTASGSPEKRTLSLAIGTSVRALNSEPLMAVGGGTCSGPGFQ